MATPRDSRVFSIPSGVPFLPTLVEALLDGTLVEGFQPKRDPLMLADATIWLPTRRAARALASEFVTRLEGEAALLPQIHALGDALDDAESFLQGNDLSGLDDVAVDPMERQLTLTMLIEKWVQALKPEARDLYGGADIIVPSSTADAVRFAADLAGLMDTVATEEADWNRLKELVPDDYGEWWQLTLGFLQIATKAWPDILAERGAQDQAASRARRLRQRAKGYARADAEGRLKGPVIAAGSTGSIPATAELLNTISRLSMGAVVLPGLDRDMEDEVWEKVDLPDNDRNESGTAPGHPQFGLRKLLRHLKIDRSSVAHLGGIDDTSAGSARVRERLISEALRPSHATDLWHEGAELPDETKALDAIARRNGLNGVALVEASGEREEALVIALALRETLARDGATCALVTPDRNLARRVAVEMRRFGVAVDDSAGQPLRNRRAGTFARLVVECAFGDGNPVALASLLKHPLARFGANAARSKRAALVLELAILRGSTVPPVPTDLSQCLEAKRQEVTSEEARYVPRSLKRLSESDWQDGAWLAGELAKIFESEPDTASTADVLAARSIAVLEACARDEKDGLVPLYGSEAGKSLQDLLSDLLDHGSGFACPAQQWPAVFDALLDSRTVRPFGGTHPRVTILGPIEARLQNYDRVVLGGLNEKTWPAVTRNDAFLSRPMKQALGLPAPERRTGLAAHDFQMLLGMRDCVLTRSTKVDNAPTIASRWVQRLLMVAGEEASEDIRGRGRKFMDWAALIDAPAGKPEPCERPAPAPPPHMRPDTLSITEIETWIRDPYEIYAKHILKLEALEPLSRETGPRERGTLIHDIMDDVSGRKIDREALVSIARKRFDEMALPPDIEALWWPRLEALAEDIVAWQSRRLSEAKQILTERNGRTDNGLDGFTLRGRADRVELLHDGRLAFFDFKTGSKPSKKEAESLYAPQLPLEAAMARRGAFDDVQAADTSELAYIRLRPSGEFKRDAIGDGKGKTKKTVADLEEEAWKQLRGLVDAYRDPRRGYTSRVWPPLNTSYESDYAHLARVSEWSVADKSGEEGGDE